MCGGGGGWGGYQATPKGVAVVAGAYCVATLYCAIRLLFFVATLPSLLCCFILLPSSSVPLSPQFLLALFSVACRLFSLPLALPFTNSVSGFFKGRQPRVERLR